MLQLLSKIILRGTLAYFEVVLECKRVTLAVEKAKSGPVWGGTI
jgi:hypothetical protein